MCSSDFAPYKITGRVTLNGSFSSRAQDEKNFASLCELLTAEAPVWHDHKCHVSLQPFILLCLSCYTKVSYTGGLKGWKSVFHSSGFGKSKIKVPGD